MFTISGISIRSKLQKKQQEIAAQKAELRKEIEQYNIRNTHSYCGIEELEFSSTEEDQKFIAVLLSSTTKAAKMLDYLGHILSEMALDKSAYKIAVEYISLKCCLSQREILAEISGIGFENAYCPDMRVASCDEWHEYQCYCNWLNIR